MPQKLRWGILSTGNIARQFCKGVRASRRGELLAIGSRTAESARKFADEFHIPSPHGSYEKVLTDPNVDAVYNALPNSMHHQWTLAALRAGKHVLCEKPLATNTTQAREMFAVARQTNRKLVEAFMYRSHPLNHAVMKSIADGIIGQVRLVRSSFCYCTNNPTNIRFSTDLAGGGLMDVGCYCINFSRAIAGADPIRVTATGHLHESGIDDLAAGTMEFPGGLIASFTCGMRVHADNTAYICGSEGYIEIPVPWKPPKQSTYIITRNTPPKMDNPNAPPAPPPRQTINISGEDELYAIEADDFAATVQDGKPPVITEADSLGNIHVLDEMRRQIGMKF